MLDYTTLIILFVATFVISFISLRVPIVGIFIIIIDLSSILDTLISGNVIMGYGYELIMGTYTVVPIIQNIPEFRYVGMILIILCACCVIGGVVKE